MLWHRYPNYMDGEGFVAEFECSGVRRQFFRETVLEQDFHFFERAREISSNARTELKIHNQDGRIGQSDSHGNDPRNIKG